MDAIMGLVSMVIVMLVISYISYITGIERGIEKERESALKEVE